MKALTAIFTRSGPSDWIIQRVTSVVITAYLVFVVGYLTSQSDLTYQQWLAPLEILSTRIILLKKILKSQELLLHILIS